MEILTSAIYWIELGQRILAAGTPVIANFKKFLIDNGIETDNTNLDLQVIDIERRKAEEEGKR